MPGNGRCLSSSGRSRGSSLLLSLLITLVKIKNLKEKKNINTFIHVDVSVNRRSQDYKMEFSFETSLKWLSDHKRSLACDFSLV